MNREKPFEIILIDDLPPEALAMLQALYSRSPKSVKEHLEKIRGEEGVSKFMGTFYVGYGHKSIGDCGSTCIFAENVSILAAKAIQDFPLYSGQEASTRYLDMNAQEVLNPLESEEGKRIQEEWMSIYQRVLDALIAFFTEKYPRKEDEKESLYAKAIKAKAFDIARGFLPAGITTYVSWHTNLRQAYDHIKELRHHPLEEIREIISKTHSSLQAEYPNSFSHKLYEKEEIYIKDYQKKLAYFDDPDIKEFKMISRLDINALSRCVELLSSRPNKAELPKQLREHGDLVFTFPLDFGSYRDLQRHRSALIPMPLLTTEHGFHQWYIDQLPEKFQLEIVEKIQEQKDYIDALQCEQEIKQYYIAMGFLVTCKVVASLHSAVYIAELRSGQTVHSTLRMIAQKMGLVMKELLPEMALYCDMEPDEWSIKRGSHDIVKKD